MDYREKDPQFNAFEAPERRLHTIDHGVHLLANNPAVRAALAEQEALAAAETHNNVQSVEFQTPRIALHADQQDRAADARQQIEDLAA